MALFLIGLAIGLSVAAGLYVYHNVVATELAKALADAKGEIDQLKSIVKL